MRTLHHYENVTHTIYHFNAVHYRFCYHVSLENSPFDRKKKMVLYQWNIAAAVMVKQRPATTKAVVISNFLLQHHP